MIQVHHFQKAYGDIIAVSRLDISVHAGEILGLVGPNGAGKTTTLRTLSCLIAPTQGELLVDGLDVTRDPIAVKQSLAYIADDPQLFNDLTVDEHLTFTASAFGVTNAAEKVEQLLADFELLKKRNTIAGELSRGMRQKLAIVCAYLRDPKVLLFDEPLTGLDPLGIRMLKESIRLRAASGAAIIVSSHLLAMVEDLCTHVLILDSGRQRFAGPVQRLRAEFGGNDVTLERIFFLATGADEKESHQRVALST